MGSLSLQIPIAGSQTVQVEFSKGNPVNAENDDFRVEKANLILDAKAKQGRYLFELVQKNRSERPGRIKVEDVTDDTAVTLADERHPILREARWRWEGEMMTFDPTNAKWLFELENSLRIYRFTIATAGGNEAVLYEAASYPANVKIYLQQLGLEPQTTPKR